MMLLPAAVLLFFVMDPLGNIPLFLSALRTVDPARHRFVIIRELLIALERNPITSGRTQRRRSSWRIRTG